MPISTSESKKSLTVASAAAKPIKSNGIAHSTQYMSEPRLAKSSSLAANNDTNDASTSSLLPTSPSVGSRQPATHPYAHFYVYDQRTETYKSLNEAYRDEVVLANPIRVKDPLVGGYILLRDAVVKGLVSCRRRPAVDTGLAERVDFKNRSSFFTHDRISYIGK